MKFFVNFTLLICSILLLKGLINFLQEQFLVLILESLNVEFLWFLIEHDVLLAVITLFYLISLYIKLLQIHLFLQDRLWKEQRMQHLQPKYSTSSAVLEPLRQFYHIIAISAASCISGQLVLISSIQS